MIRTFVVFFFALVCGPAYMIHQGPREGLRYNLPPLSLNVLWDGHFIFEPFNSLRWRGPFPRPAPLEVSFSLRALSSALLYAL